MEARDDSKSPDISDLDKVWAGIKFEIIDREFEFIQLLNENLDSNIFFKGFRLQDNDTFDWYCSRGRLNEIKFYDYFLLSKAVLGQFVEKVYYSNGTQEVFTTLPIDKKPIFEWVNALCLDGELASILYHGGVRGSKLNKPVQEVKKIAQKFCDDLFEEEYHHEYVHCLKSYQAWNTWFNNFIIDDTFIIICLKTRIIWILAHTDMD